MKIKNELRAAFQLLGLLCLLFWSFTWNIPKGFDLTKPKRSLKTTPEYCLRDAFENKKTKKRSIFEVSSQSRKYYESDPDFLLPPFNVWKEVELSKREERGDRNPVSKVPRRKLNYASAKCGAKILTSNKESKHRMSILNEKVDEYMLNPCGIKVWFIVELCDTIETSQVELANYELYSSVPKDFSVFWSHIYPTQTWHYLGTFQAENHRSMQTFDIDDQNLGKFIKVVIHSHHGREHFCPLSVFRVVGYSMVYEYDDIEVQKDQKTTYDSSINDTLPKSEESVNTSKEYSSIKQIKLEANSLSNSISGVFPVKLCQMMQKFCSISQLENACIHQPACTFIEIVIFKDESLSDICMKELESDANNNSKKMETITPQRSNIKDKSKNSRAHWEDKANTQNRMSRNLKSSTTTVKSLDEPVINFSSKELNRSAEHHFSEIISSKIDSTSNATNRTFANNQKITQTGEEASINILQPKEKVDIVYSDNKCECSNALRVIDQRTLKQNSSSEATQFQQDATDSATLIQKESVLIKMNLRIKMLETNLSLINRYLQHLSESYRMQVEDMLGMFDGTIKVITMTSAKAAIIDKQQQLIIDQLDRKVNALSMKIQLLGNRQNGLLKQVMELHGFFLILEIITMSTIFSVFFNKFKRDVLYT